MAYGTMSRSRGRTFRTRRSSAKKAVPVPRKKRVSYVRKNAVQINRLSYSVNKLKAAAFGQKQYGRQLVRSLTMLPDAQIGRVSAHYPVAFCHQAIGENTAIWQVALDSITGEIVVAQTGAWQDQPFPLVPLDPLSVRYDQLKYSRQNPLGVQPGYLHMSTSYDCLFIANQWAGWVEICLVTPRKQFTRQATPQNDVFQLPSGLAGFSDSALGTPNQYAIQPSFYGVKVLKRMYFNTVTTVGTSQLHTNPQRTCRITIKNDKYKSHIRAQKPSISDDPISSLDIPLHQQTWVMIRSTNPQEPTAAAHMAVVVKRCPVWRDSLGSS